METTMFHRYDEHGITFTRSAMSASEALERGLAPCPFCVGPDALGNYGGVARR